MATHIPHTRQIRSSRRRPISALLPADNAAASFCVFAGTLRQRRSAALAGIRRCAGRMGILVLHNDPGLPAALRELPVQALFPNFGGSLQYDPLYGLDREGILNSIVPQDNPGLRGWLNAYLDILQLQFARYPGELGRYFCNLDALLALVSLPVYRLDQQVLQNLPQEEAQRIYARLSEPGAQTQVLDAVQALALELRGRIWQPREPEGHTCISAVDALAKGQLLCLQISGSRPRLLRTLYEELRLLTDARRPFLLVADDILLTDSPQLRSLFTQDHRSQNYATGLISSSLPQVAPEEAELGQLLHSAHEVLIFGCTDALQAQPFSQALGSYRRLVRDHQTQKYRQPFHLFSGHSRSTSIREVPEQNVTAGELTTLGEGAVLCGSLYNPPVLIRRVDLDL